ncbi:MAG: ATP-binding protein [Salinivirgaceae bacterium]|jgi:signal transduction histidine kinase/CheY-like chemotaxis protein/HPt (histidine-containing phosphotransfer) domain-containing protein|nr:ATP-binding protein [Salinivirgaceae bacterium]
MENTYIYTTLIILVVIGINFFITYFFLKKEKENNLRFDYNNIIQKKTYTLFFNNEGFLQSTSSNSDQKNVMASLEIGQHISEYKKFKNMEKYFESCKNSKKNLSLKLLEDREVEFARRHDLVFTPLIENNEVSGVFVISQELLFKTGIDGNSHQQKELVEQRDYALKQINAIEAQKSELELAFKKSSKHHIMLQKALRQIEIQKTDLEKALEIINDQKMELEKANKEIRESSRMKEIFLANTSHEIRTPLNAIIGFTNLLLNDDLGEAHRKYIENIKASGNNLLVVINDILDFSKIESGKLTLEQIEFNFKNLIQHTFNTIQVKSQEKNIELKYAVSDEISEIIIGDPVRLNQILINLLGNSIKFTNEKGSVRLLATKGKSEDGFIKILFKVEDNGIGIPLAKLSDIFQSFTQGESDTTRKYGGTGLGLSIVKQLIELQGGEITVESTIGKGTAFTFYVILKPGIKAIDSHVKHEKQIVDSSATDDMKILLVEDNIINQQLAFDTIKSWNNKINIELANNGKIAVEKLEKTNYDLVLMDIQMPEMDGNEATQEIRKMPYPKNETNIMAMTAHALKNERENCLNMGMDDYISKPFDPDELFIKILNFAIKKGKHIEEYVETKKSEQEVEKSDFTKEAEYKFFHVENLKKIYQDNQEKIIKIVSMCFDSIPNELTEIQNAYDKNEWKILRNKAHSLKPKLGYLGMESMQTNAKNIELSSQNEAERENIKALISEIKNHWELATPELAQFIKS